MPALIVRIVGDARSLEQSLAKAGAATEAAGGKMERLGKAAGAAGLLLTGGLAYGLEKSAKAALGAEASQARLEQAFKAAHVAIGPLTGSIDKAEGASRKLGFTDDDVRESLGSLIVSTHNYKTSLGDLSIAENLARLKHISLADATRVLTMMHAG